MDLIGRLAAGMSSGLRLPTNQTYQRRRRNVDKRDNDKSSGEDVLESSHSSEPTLIRIHFRQFQYQSLTVTKFLQV